MKRVHLSYESSYTTPQVYPKNNATLLQTWSIMYRFYNSDFPKGKQICIKGDINSLKSIKERKIFATELIKREVAALHNGFNPIIQEFEGIDTDVSVNTPTIQALWFAHSKLQTSKAVKKNIEIFINRFSKSYNKPYLSIGSIKRRDIKDVFERMDLPDSLYNLYLAYLSILVNELIEYDIFEANFVKSIKKRKLIKKLREVLSMEQFLDIINYLKETDYNFYRFTMIYFFSDTRITELYRLKREDVDIDKQELKVLLLKGSLNTQIKKPIIAQALPFWTEIIGLANENEYLFTKELKPSSTPTNSSQIGKRFRKHIKLKFGIKEDFATLRHRFMIELKKTLTNEQIRVFSGHTNNSILSHYLVDQKDNELEAMKLVKVNLD